MTIVFDYRALISGYSRKEAGTPADEVVYVSYSFLTDAQVPTLSEYQPYENNGYFSFTIEQRLSFRLAISAIEHVSNVRFVEEVDPQNSEIWIMNTSGSVWGGWAGYPYDEGGYLVVDGIGSYAPGTGNFETLLHETGHALGLKHPFSIGSSGLVLDTSLDNENHTQMSYTGNGIDDTSMAHLDIDALQFLYGAPTVVNLAQTWNWSDIVSTSLITGDAGNNTLFAFAVSSAVNGGAGNDMIWGQDGNDFLVGEQGDDIILGGEGEDSLNGNDGSDWLYGQGGDDTINAGAGAMDVSLGDDGNDTINGEAGFDYMYGYDGNDTTRGGTGIDVAYGGAGNDNLYGDDGADWLFGEAGNDKLFGGAGADLLMGGTGTDEITGGAGNDWMWGGDMAGAGDGVADTFFFGAAWGGDVIWDFEDGKDMLDVSGAGITSFADLTIGTFGQFTTITSASGDIIYLRGAGDVAIAESSIDASDFIFA